jgi:phospholipase/carboxylesterase
MTQGRAPLHGAAPAEARAVCVFAHGRGWTPERTVAEILGRLDAPGVAFVLPRAPGDSWYAARAVEALTAATRADLNAALDLLAAAMADAAAAAPGRPLVLAGFSQGACLSLEWLMRRDPLPDAVVAFTGCRLGTPACVRPVRALAGLPVYLSGSDADPFIPPASFAQAVEALAGAGAALRADSLPGRAHAVSDRELGVMAAMLAGLSVGREPALVS